MALFLVGFGKLGRNLSVGMAFPAGAGLRRSENRKRARRRNADRSAPADRGGAPMIRMVLADDHTIVREGLKQLLLAASDLHGGRRKLLLRQEH